MGTYVKKNGQLEEISPVYTAGTGIEIQDNVVKAIPYTAGTGIEIQNNVVKAIPYTAGKNILINENKEISCDISTMNFKGSVETYDKLPTDGQDVGDVWNIPSMNINYCWNGSNWISIGSSVDISGLMNKDGSNAAFPEHKGSISNLSTILIDGGDGFKTRKIRDIKSNFFPVDTILSKTSENPVQNKIITANMFVVFASETYDDNINFILPDAIPMEKGVRIKFVQDKYEMLRNSLDNNFTINGRNVYVNKHGTPIIMPSHTVNDVTLCVMQKYVAVEMVFLPELATNGGWLVLGNPEVITGSTSDSNYAIKADGLIEQWGHYTYPAYDRYREYTFVLPISYSSTYSYSVFVTASGDEAGERYVEIGVSARTNNSFQIQSYMKWVNNHDYYTKGY